MTSINQHLLKQYTLKTQNIDLITKRAIDCQEKRIPEKYSNIQATLKLLSNLIIDLKKKSDIYEQELKSRAKIQDIMEQISFHKNRVFECERLSMKIKQNIQQKKSSIGKQQQIVLKLRKEIIQLKTDNVKKIFHIQELAKLKILASQKQKLQSKHHNWKIKTMYQSSFLKNEPNKLKNTQLLERQKNQLTQKLHNKIQQKVQTLDFIDTAFELLRQNLLRQQRKSNSDGLNGSLMFKMIQNTNEPVQKKIKENKQSIYDLLKQRHRKVMKKQKNEKENINVKEDQFMEYTPQQILGIIELKGGISKLKQKINNYEENKNSAKNITIERKNAKKIE